MSATIDRLYEHYFRLTGDANAASRLVLAAVQAPEVPEKLLSTEEVAKLLSTSAETVRTLARRHEIENVRVGRGFRFRQSHVDEYLRKGSTLKISTALDRH